MGEIKVSMGKAQNLFRSDAFGTIFSSGASSLYSQDPRCVYTYPATIHVTHNSLAVVAAVPRKHVSFVFRHAFSTANLN